MNWNRLQNHCFLAPKGKTTKKQRKALKQRREAFKRACKTEKQEEKKEKQPIDKTPKVFPPISLTGK